MVRVVEGTLGKRPADATPEKALRMIEAGATYRELGKAWGISGQRVFQLVTKARKTNQ